MAAASAVSLLSDSKMPRRCPRCQEKGLETKVKKLKVFSQKRYFCLSELCTWPLTKEQMLLLYKTRRWDSIEPLGSPLAQSTPVVGPER